MNRKLRIGTVLTISIAAFMPFGASAESTCMKRYKIGVSLPLTAGAVSSGEAVKNSIILADERFDRQECVDFVFDDDQLLAKNTVTNVRKFIDIDHVDALIVYGTPTALAAGEIVESAKVPMIALSILSKVVEGRKYVVKHWCTAERLNEAVSEEVRRRRYGSVAIVSTQNDAMLNLRDLFRASGAASVALDEEFVRDEMDFTTIAAKITSKKADAIYVLLYPPQTAPFIKRVREAGYRGDIFGVHNIEDPHEVKASNGAMNGVWFANGDDSRGESYPEAYRLRFGTPTALGGASGYDAAKLILDAVERNLSINDHLHTVRDFEGAFGRYGATAKSDFDFPAVIKRVEADGFGRIGGAE